MLRKIKLGLLALALSTTKDYRTARQCWEEIDRLMDERKTEYILKYSI